MVSLADIMARNTYLFLVFTVEGSGRPHTPPHIVDYSTSKIGHVFVMYPMCPKKHVQSVHMCSQYIPASKSSVLRPGTTSKRVCKKTQAKRAQDGYIKTNPSRCSGCFLVASAMTQDVYTAGLDQ